MEGRLGAIYVDDKQVGGFLDWHIKMNLTDGVKGEDRTHKLQSWKVTAWAHWLTQPLIPGTEVRLKLCADDGPAYWEGKGKVANQLTATLHTLIHVIFEVFGSGELEAKKVEDEG